jgi:integrase
MGIIKRNSIYYVRKSVCGKIIQFSLNTTDLRLARELYELWLKENFLNLRNAKEHGKQEKSKNNTPEHQSIDKVWEEYIGCKRLENLSKSQMNVKVKVFNDLKTAGFKSLNDFKQDGINRLMTDYQGRYQSDSIKKYVSEIKCFLNYCIKTGHYRREEYDRLSWPRLIMKVNTTVINDTDLERIFIQALKADKDIYVYLTSLYYLSCRPGEVPGIKKEDFDFTAKTCRIWMNKTKKFKTVVITNTKYLQFIEKYLAPMANNSAICRDHNSKEHYSRKFKQLKETLNLAPEYTLYSIRHTAGTNIYKNTKDVKFTAHQLGDKEEIAIRHYVNLNLSNYQQYENSL